MKTALAAAMLAALSMTASAGQKTEISIVPGPTSMSTAEKGIVPDVGKDVQHGVILIEETEQDDDYGNMTQTAYHMRAKILSPEARSLADIAIPVERGASDLKKWWGRTILPDGRVLELPESGLTTQLVAKSSSGKIQELRGALPGVVPGCVIDYGYVVEQSSFNNSTRVFLQRSWPVRSTRYRWQPSHYFPAAYVLSRSEGLAIDVKYDKDSVLVTAHNLSPVPEEPDMPPMDEARASATFYYYTRNETVPEFWDLEARRVERALKAFLGNNAAAKEVVASLKVPPDASREAWLRAAYEWLEQNVKNTWLRSAEEQEFDDQEENTAYNAKTVLKAKLASPRQLDFLFAGLARALGAEANIVYAVDRTDRFWNKSLKWMGQFGYTFVAVRFPGEPDDKLVLADPGSGLAYGLVPWRATGVTGMMCNSKGSTAVPIPVGSPVVNRADTRARVTFSDDNETMVTQWSRTSGGATGIERRRWLRDLDARERKEWLDRLCGASGVVEVTAAELPGLEERSAPFQIACDLEESDLSLSEDLAWYSVPVAGPWWPETPNFTAATRVHPVIFDYPKLDITGIDIAAPHGFKPKAPPSPVKLESPYGRYELVVTATPTGFRVDRAFALTVLMAKVDEYPALRKFFDEVRKADRTSVTFERIAEAQ